MDEKNGARREPWETDKTRIARKVLRRAERKINKSHDDNDRKNFFTLRSTYRAVADNAQSVYYSDMIEDTDQKHLYKRVSAVMHRKKSNATRLWV